MDPTVALVVGAAARTKQSADDLLREYWDRAQVAGVEEPFYGAMGAGDPLSALSAAGISVPSTPTAGQAATYAFNASGLASQVPDGATTALEPYASGVLNFSGMTEQGQTQFAEQVTVGIVSAIPGAGIVLGPLLELTFQAFGTAQEGQGCCGSPDLSNPYGTCPSSQFTWASAFGSSPPTETPGSFQEFFSNVCQAAFSAFYRCWVSDPKGSGNVVQGITNTTGAEQQFAGLLVPAVAAWNKTHVGTGSAQYTSSGAPIPGSGGSIGISYEVNTYGTFNGVKQPGMPISGDPLAMALNAIAVGANSSGATIAPNSILGFDVNNGPVISQQVALPQATTSGSAAKSIAIGVGVAAAAVAGGIGVVALTTGTSYGAAATSTWSFLSGGLAAGAAEKKRRRKPTHVQTLLFPRSQWTPSTAKRWAKAHGYRYGYVDTTENYHRIRQTEPKRGAISRTIDLGSSGVRAVVQRAK